MKTVFCPLKNNQINGIGCLVVCDVVEKMLAPSAIPEGINWNEDMRVVCKACPYHNDIK